jgi:hypothetical protein
VNAAEWAEICAKQAAIWRHTPWEQMTKQVTEPMFEKIEMWAAEKALMVFFREGRRLSPEVPEVYRLALELQVPDYQALPEPPPDPQQIARGREVLKETVAELAARKVGSSAGGAAAAPEQPQEDLVRGERDAS